MFEKYVMLVYVADPRIDAEVPLGVKICSLEDFNFFAQAVVEKDVEILSVDLYRKI